MFITALLAIANKWKQPKCTSKNEWIKKMWSIYTAYNGILLSHKNEKNPSFAIAWVDLEIIILSKISQTAFFIDVKLAYNIMLISGTAHRDFIFIYIVK